MSQSLTIPSVAMVLAAGLGSRLHPLSATVPKPLVSVGGTTALRWVLEHLQGIGVTRVVINTHHLAHLVTEAFRAYCQDLHLEGIIMHEPLLLGTGGGLKNALPHLGKAPFFMVNSDMLWSGDSVSPLLLLAQSVAERNLVTLGLTPRGAVWGEEDPRGYTLMHGHFQRRQPHDPPAPYIFTGLRIVRPELLDLLPDLQGPHEILDYFDAAAAHNSLGGVILPPEIRWWPLDTLEALHNADRYFGQQVVGGAA